MNSAKAQIVDKASKRRCILMTIYTFSLFYVIMFHI